MKGNITTLSYHHNLQTHEHGEGFSEDRINQVMRTFVYGRLCIAPVHIFVCSSMGIGSEQCFSLFFFSFFSFYSFGELALKPFKQSGSRSET